MSEHSLTPTTPELYSGKLPNHKKFLPSPKNLEEELDLYRKISRDEPVTRPADPSLNPKLKGFVPIFKHPLPLSENRPIHERTLRRILSMSIEKQAMAAATLGNAWVLEEVYLRGASVEIKDKSGFRPIHMAVQNNNFESIMVLLNIGIDLNVTTNSGMTPLYLARAVKSRQAEILLTEQKAKLTDIPKSVPPGATVLSVYDKQYDAPSSVLSKTGNWVGLPKHTDLI